MAVRFVEGDLLSTTQVTIAQGVVEGNQEGLGTGLAFKISRKWPEVQAGFKKHARRGGFRGGDLSVYPPSGNPAGLHL